MKIKISSKNQYVTFFGLFFLTVIFAPSVFATGKPDSIAGPKGVGRNLVASQEERKQQKQTRLTEVKLTACQAKEKAIKKRAEQLTKLATTIEEKFAAIAGRVQKYYTSKVVPSGKTVANYDSLVADIQTKKAAVQTALTSAQNKAGTFSCEGNDPKEQLLQFREDMKTVKSALRDYRTSIKNLTVAVRSVTGTTERNNPTSPKPTKTEVENE